LGVGVNAGDQAILREPKANRRWRRLPSSFAAYANATEITASACPAVFLRFSS